LDEPTCLVVCQGPVVKNKDAAHVFKNGGQDFLAGRWRECADDRMRPQRVVRDEVVEPNVVNS
jgi:hypothetical protein